MLKLSSKKWWKTSLCSAKRSAPQVLGVFPLKLGFDARVVFAPEAGQILRDLDGFHPGREDVHHHRDAAQADLGGLVDIV